MLKALVRVVVVSSVVVEPRTWRSPVTVKLPPTEALPVAVTVSTVNPPVRLTALLSVSLTKVL